MTSEDLERTVVQAARRADHGRSRWAAVLAVLAVLGVGGLAVRDWYRSHRLDEVTVVADSNAATAQELYDQLRELGQVPRVPPPSVQGERGPQGPRGERGERGEQGIQGEPGPEPACNALPTRCIGPPGPLGEKGDKGDRGEQGEQGEQGIQGEPGQDGEPPLHWSTTHADGSVETCQRAPDYTPEAPTYTCVVTEPEPGPPPLPLLPGG